MRQEKWRELVTRWLLPILTVSLLVGCGEENEAANAPADYATRAETSATPTDVPFSHPMLSVATVEGLVPGVDLKQSPDGRRYAIQERITSGTLSPRYTGGVIAAESHATRPEERVEQPPAVEQPDNPPPNLSARDQETLQTSPWDEQFAVSVRLRRHPRPPFYHDFERAIALERPQTQREAAALRQRIRQDRQDQLTAIKAPLIAQIEEATDLYIRDLEQGWGFIAIGTPDQLLELAAMDEVVAMSLDTPVVNNADTDGSTVAAGSQLNQFIDANYDGEVGPGSSDDLHVALMDARGFQDDHLGFNDTSTGSSRIAARKSCTNLGCSSVLDFATPITDDDNHGTVVAGFLLGDLYDGQDSSYTTQADRHARSGYAREARLRYYKTSTTNGINYAYAHIAGSSSVTISASTVTTGNTDPNCLGMTSTSAAVNDLYEAGVSHFQAAGNVTTVSVTNCNVQDPGSAIGAFTVGAHGNSGFANEIAVRTASIWDQTASGGRASPHGGYNWGEGRNRSIIDITAYSCRRLGFHQNGGYYDNSAWCGTSFATPVVGAAAIDLIDFFRNTYPTTSIEDPGRLYAALLLMGDRQGLSGGKLSSGFDHRFGAGRLKMRKFDDAGMDKPTLGDWEFVIGRTCVDHGETVELDVYNGASIPYDMDDFKGVAWWYDPAHETGSAIANVDMKLVQVAPTVTTLTTSNSYYDNKERVFRDYGLGWTSGQKLKIQLIGTSVTSDNLGCGANSMMVYYAWFMEDADRDDADGPTASEIEPE